MTMYPSGLQRPFTLGRDDSVKKSRRHVARWRCANRSSIEEVVLRCWMVFVSDLYSLGVDGSAPGAINWMGVQMSGLVLTPME